MTPAIVQYAQAAYDYTVRTMRAAGDPGVVIVVASADGSVACRETGVLPGGQPITCDTRMPIASLTKAFTAFAVVQLATVNRVELQAPVWRYLPELRRTAEHVRVIDLLEQRSGYTTSEGIAAIASGPRTVASAALDASKYMAVPRERFEYSNVNYDVLGAIVERVSGEAYDEYMQRHVFGPLGLNDVRECSTAQSGFSRVFSHPVRLAMRTDLCSDVAAGGLVMTPRAYGRWLAAILDGGRTWTKVALRSDAWRDIFVHPAGSRYAKGWYVYRWGDGNIEYYHNGWAPQYHAFATVFPKRDAAIARFADANEVPDGGRELFSNAAMEDIVREQPLEPIPPVPQDLYLRVPLACLIALLSVRLFRSRTRGAALACTIDAVVAIALLCYVWPQWGGDIRNGWMFSPDLTLLILMTVGLVTADAIASARAFVKRPSTTRRFVS